MLIWLAILVLSHLLGPVAFAGTPIPAEPSRLVGPVQTTTTATTIAGREGERVVSHYDSSGNETETVRYADTDSIVEKSVHTYNSNGKKTETITYNPDGSLLTKTLYLYDFQGRLSETTTLDDVGIINHMVYTSDEKRQTVEETITPARQEVTRRLTHFYDSKGLETSTVIIARDGGMSKITFVYDDKGDLTERVVCAKDGSVIDRLRYEYEFDAVGNWIKQTEFICPPAEENVDAACTPAAMTVRTITYAVQNLPSSPPKKDKSN